MMPSIPELVVAALIAVAYPICDYLWIWPHMLRIIRSGRPNSRVPVYGEIIALLWLMTLAIAALWILGGRPWSALGLVRLTGWHVVAIAALIIVGIALNALRSRAISRLRPEQLQKLRSSQSPMLALGPRTHAEALCFHAVSVSAGICEEFIYRGFLVWALQPWLTLWGAATVSVVSFAFAHSYQGRRGAITVGAVGAVFAALALVTGSIVPGMVVHAFVDILEGRSSYSLLRDDETEPGKPSGGRSAFLSLKASSAPR